MSSGLETIDPEVLELQTGQKVTIRTCKGFDELDACVELQELVWGYSDGDIIPRRVFAVAQAIGGQAIGAFAGTEMLGFAMALPGIKAGARPYLHSHMLAVLPGLRNAGIGRRLKLYQRREALARGIDHMEWTFDPLEIKNSYLNIHRLGAVVRRYLPNFYGVSSSRLQGGLPTDRLVAEWELGSRRVEDALAGQAGVGGAACAECETIVLPADIGLWRNSPQEMSRALAVQTENRERFQRAFSNGRSVTGFRRDAEGNGIFELTK